MSPKKTSFFFTILTQKWNLKKFYLITFCETAQICSSTYCYHKTKIKKGVTALLTEIFLFNYPYRLCQIS